MLEARQTNHAVRVECQSVIVLLLVVIPILLGLLHWLNLTVRERVYLGDIAQTYVDPGGTLTIVDMTANAADLFPPASGSTANLGVRTSSASAFWVRLPLSQARALIGDIGNSQLALSFEEPRFRRVDLYIVDREGHPVETQRFVRDAVAGYRFPVFSLPPGTLEADSAYARIVTGSSMRATVYLAPEQTFKAIYGRTTIGFGLLLGMMAASVVYLAAFGLMLRNSTYLSLGAAILFAGLYIASDQALLETYLLPGAVTLSRANSLAAAVFFYGAFLGFAVRFFQFGTYSRPLRRCVDAFAALVFMIALAAWIDGITDTGLLRRYLPYVGLASAVVLVGLMVIAARYAFRRAMLFAILWLPLLVTGLSRLWLDTAPGEAAGPMALNGVYFGFAISLLLFAVVTPLELYRRELMLRQRAQSLLARLESFANIGRDIYFETDRSGNLVYLSGGRSNEVDTDEAMTLAQAIGGGFPLRSLDAISSAQATAARIRNHIVPVGENTADLRWFSISGEPADGTNHFRGIVRDVTVEIEQENLRHQERHLISLGSLAATVAHEINNVVQPIVNMSNALRGHTRNTPAAERMLDLIDLAAQQAATLVGQILKVGARNSDRVPKGHIDIAVRDAVETLKLILPASLTLEARVEIIEDVTVKPGDILQMLINMVANARRASGDASVIQIELTAVPMGAQLSVIDHGEGMSEAMRLRATDPYFTTKTDGRAAGIGLGVVKRLVEDHGGSLAITSQQGQGTRVDLFFPRYSGSTP